MARDNITNGYAHKNHALAEIMAVLQHDNINVDLYRFLTFRIVVGFFQDG